MGIIDIDALKANPLLKWVALLTLLGSLSGGVTWAVSKMEAADGKADSALAAVKEVKGSMDTFIMLQREANQLKREEMAFQGIRVQTKTVSSSSSETSSSIESAVREVSVRTGSGIVVIEYKPDSLRNGVIRKDDTMWVPIADSANTRPR